MVEFFKKKSTPKTQPEYTAPELKKDQYQTTEAQQIEIFDKIVGQSIYETRSNIRNTKEDSQKKR